jgi:uncharacterized protein (TIGR02145 family)
MKQYILILSILLVVICSCKKSNVGNHTIPPPVTDTTTTAQSNTKVVDYDGNVYDTIKIGDQVWLQEGLRATHYRNGADVPGVTADTVWSKLTTGALCSYNNDTMYINSFGYLYNWYAISNPAGLCPKGWHIPSDSEWSVLVANLGGPDVAGGALKTTTVWSSPNTGATNSSGFMGYPTGYRYYNGAFQTIGNLGTFWSSTKYNDSVAIYRTLNYRNSEFVSNVINARAGFSCRCIRDN